MCDIWCKCKWTFKNNDCYQTGFLNTPPSLGAFLLQICAKPLQYFINVDKKLLQNDSVSINQSYAVKPYLISSREKS